MTGRACMEVVLIQEETSKLFDKQVSAQKVKKLSKPQESIKKK